MFDLVSKTYDDDDDVVVEDEKQMGENWGLFQRMKITLTFALIIIIIIACLQLLPPDFIRTSQNSEANGKRVE
ncbi:hypothetical protein BLOT_005323 [Blomia tropicalis]|nr:hypothetical protein BLOT_005323 [Blomia tropicalis]